jgi:hypothetical protein
MKESLSIDGRLIMRDLRTTIDIATLLLNRLEQMKDGEPIDTMLVANICKARGAMLSAYEVIKS